MPTRDAKRRGSGWLPGQADIGWSNRLGWFEGFHLLLAVNPQGVITGFGFATGSTKDQPLAESLLAARQRPHARLRSVGAKAHGFYVADRGFEGVDYHAHWQQDYGACVLSPPKRNSKQPWSKGLRRWIAGIRQIIESVYVKLHQTFGLDRERPHDLGGFQTRLAAKVALHNFCIRCNWQHGRDALAFADLLDW